MDSTSVVVKTPLEPGGPLDPPLLLPVGVSEGEDTKRRNARLRLQSKDLSQYLIPLN